MFLFTDHWNIEPYPFLMFTLTHSKLWHDDTSVVRILSDTQHYVSPTFLTLPPLVVLHKENKIIWSYIQSQVRRGLLMLIFASNPHHCVQSRQQSLASWHQPMRAEDRSRLTNQGSSSLESWKRGKLMQIKQLISISHANPEWTSYRVADTWVRIVSPLVSQ